MAMEEEEVEVEENPLYGNDGGVLARASSRRGIHRRILPFMARCTFCSVSFSFSSYSLK